MSGTKQWEEICARYFVSTKKLLKGLGKASQRFHVFFLAALRRRFLKCIPSSIPVATSCSVRYAGFNGRPLCTVNVVRLPVTSGNKHLLLLLLVRNRASRVYDSK